MFSNGGGDVRSGLAPHFRDSSSKPSEHALTDMWERQALLRVNFDRAERDNFTSAKRDSAMDAQGSISRSSNAVVSNVGSLGPSAKRRVLGRHGPIHENGRYGSVVSRPLESVFHIRSPPENGKAERDMFSSAGGPSPVYSSSPDAEKPSKDSDGGNFRRSHLSSCETRPASSPCFDRSPRFDPLGKLYRTQNTCDGPGLWERERSKFSSSSTVRDTPYRDKEKPWGRPEYHRRTYSLPKLDSPRDWSLGDTELFEGRIDRYGSASIREPALSDVLSINSKERNRYDWRTRDRSLIGGFSSQSSICAPLSNSHLKDAVATPARIEEPRPKSPPGQLAAQNSLLTQHNPDIDAGPTSPKKRPRLTWGQGLAKYEKEKIEDHSSVKKCESGCDGVAECHEDLHFSLDCQSHLTENGSISPPYNQHNGRNQGWCDSGVSLSGGELERSLTSQNFAINSCLGTEENSEDQSDADVRQLSPSISPRKNLAYRDAAPQPSCLHEVQVLLSNILSEKTRVSKDDLTHQVEKVEQEIDRLEKELIKLGSDETEETVSFYDAPNLRIEVHKNDSFDTTVSARESQQRHSEDSSVIVAAYNEALPFLHNDNTRQASGSLQISQEATDLSHSDMGGCDVHDSATNMNGSAGQPGEGGQSRPCLEVSSTDKDVGLVESILLSNHRTADLSSASLAHLNSLKTQAISQSGSLYASPEQADVWSHNAEIHSRKRKRLQVKIVEEISSIKFVEKVLAVKFRAYREVCKQKQSGSDFPMEWERSFKMMEGRQENNMNGSIHHSSFKLRLNSDPMIRRVEKEVIPTGQLLKNSSLFEIERGFLKMPAMHLGSRERELHTFDTKNGLVDDPVSAEQERKYSNPWSKEEKKLFLEKYSLFGKEFRRIAAYLDHKTVADCVEFYYRNQKTEEFEKVRQKHLLEKQCKYQLERHSVEQSAFYYATSRSIDSRHYEGVSACLQGLTLVAAAAAAMSTPTKPTYRGLATQACRKLTPTQFAVRGMRNVECKGARSTHSRGRSSYEELNVDWSDNETQRFLDALVNFGKDFETISQHMGTRSAWQCRSFFSKARRHLQLDQLVERHKGVQALRAKNGTCAPFPKDRNTGPDTGAEAFVLVQSLASAEPLHVNCDFKEARGSNVLESLQEVGNGVCSSHQTSTLESVSHIPDDQIKQEACTISDSGEKSFGDVSAHASSGNVRLLHAVKDCRLEDILVCGETLQFKAEVKAEPSHTVSEVCNGGHSEIKIMSAPLGASSAVSTSAPSSIPIASSVESTLGKDHTIKMMETKARREPTSWTQEEKNKFVEVLKVHGKNWDRLCESLPGKSLTQIKTYFQNSKAKLGFWSEGAVNGNGKVCFSRKRKVDDSDSSSNAGSGVQNVSQKVAVHTEDANFKVSPSVFVSSGGLASQAIVAEVMCADLLSRNVVEDSGVAHSRSNGLYSSTSTAGITPIFNPSVYTSSNLHSHQFSGHPNPFKVQPVGLKQPQHGMPTLVAVQPLQQQVPLFGMQQQVGSPGLHQMYPPQQFSPSGPTSRVLQDLPLPVAQHLHKQHTLLQSENKQQTLVHQHQQQVLQQLKQQLQQQVTEAVLQQHLPTHLLQRQQLQMLFQQVPHNHLQQMSSQHQQANQQVPNQVVSQRPQGTTQNPGSQLAYGSQSITNNEQLQQQAELFAQLYQMHCKSPLLLQHQQQLQQLQVLQLHWQQQHAQLFQVPAKQDHMQLSHLQPLNMSFLNEQHQKLAVLKGNMQGPGSCADTLKQSESSNSISSKTQRGPWEELHPLPSISQGIQMSTQFQSVSEGQSRPTDVKLFGQSLLSQPVSSAQQQSGKVTSLSSEVAFSAPSSISVEENLTSQPLGDAVTHRPGWPVVNSGSSTGLSNGGVESELCSVQDALAQTNKRLLRGAKTKEDGQANEGSFVHTPAEQAPDSRLMSSMLPCDLKRPKSNESTYVQDCETSAKQNRLQGFQPPSLAGQGASHGLPRVLDALVALAEWRVQNANGGSGKLMDEFFSQSWDALQRDPGSLVEAGKAGGFLAQLYAGNLEIQRHLKDGFSSLQPPMHLLAGANGGCIHVALDALSQPSPVLCPLNGEHDMRDLEGRSVVG